MSKVDKMFDNLASNSENKDFSKKEHAEEQEFNRVYNKIREAILNNKKGYTLGAAREIFESLTLSEAKRVLEMFNEQEGALPGELGDEYIKLVYSPSGLLEKMEKGQTFYEAVASLSKDVRDKHIILDNDAIQIRIKKSSDDILRQTEDGDIEEASKEEKVVAKVADKVEAWSDKA